MKPIEVGCMVVVVAGEYAGCFGTVMQFLPAGSRVTVQQPVLRDVICRVDLWAVNLHDNGYRVGYGHNEIMRIDGHEPTTADYELLELVTS